MSQKIEQELWTEMFGTSTSPYGDNNVIRYFTILRQRLEENLFFATAHAQARANGQTEFWYDGACWTVKSP